MTSNSINLQKANAETMNAESNRRKNEEYIRDLQQTRGFRNAQSVLSGIGAIFKGAGSGLTGGAKLHEAL